MLYFTPGPTQLYPTVRKHIKIALVTDIPSLSHRSELFHTMVKNCYEQMRELMAIPQDYHIFFFSSATEAMERIIENTVERQSFHFVQGAFSERFYDIAVDLKKNASKHESLQGTPIDFKILSYPQKTELFAITHNETSSGTAIPVQNIYDLKKKFPKTLIALDVVSSAPIVDLDFTKLDLVFFSVQKAFGLPAGLAVLIVSPQAMEKAASLEKKGIYTGSYRKFSSLAKEEKNYQTTETPNVLGIYLLERVLKDMLKKGITPIRKEAGKKAQLFYNFFEQNKLYKPLVSEKSWQSQTVIVIKTPHGSSAMLQKLKEQGYVLGAGYGSEKENQIRIANFPATTKADVAKLLDLWSSLQLESK